MDKVANIERWLHLWGMLLEEQGDQDLLFCLQEVGRADGGRAGMCHPAKKWGAEGTAAAGKLLSVRVPAVLGLPGACPELFGFIPSAVLPLQAFRALH